MDNLQFHHALQVNNDLCFGCSHCMKVCPTEAIRIKNGKASIYEHRCIDCGECFRACPVSAIFVEHDDFNTIFNYNHRIALVPTVFYGQFSKNSFAKINSALREIGFTDIIETGNSVDVLFEATQEFIQKNQDKKPLISSFCPAIVRLIQVKFPSMVDHIITLKPPLDIAALFAKKSLMDKGFDESEIGIFYITPCAAKIAAVKSPVGEQKSDINGVINMNFIYNKIYKILKSSVHLQSVEKEYYTKKSILWSLTNGEVPYFQGRCLAIDEINNVTEFLEKVENDEIKGVDYLELRACDQSCAGGILTTKNRFIAVENLKKKAEQVENSEKKEAPIDDYKKYISDNISIHKLKPRSMLKLDENMTKALNKMEKAQKVMCYLPGFDCGACGAPSCQALAEDIAQRSANISNCVFIQKMMEVHGKLDNMHALRIIEKVWGKKRLNKKCNKGTQNESF